MIKLLIFNMMFTIVFFFSNFAYALCINVSEANLRKGPGIKYEKIGQVPQYMPLKELSKEEDWYKVKDVKGKAYWIYEKLVTNNFECAVVTTDVANIRSGPGKGYSTVYISPAMKYEFFKITKNKDLWVKVKDEFGNAGWIFRNLLWIQ